MDSDLDWLPESADWQHPLDEAKRLELAEALERYRLLANSRMDFARTVKLDRVVHAHVERHLAAGSGARVGGFTPVRLALLGSSTLTHLVPGIRVAGLRRGLLIEVYEGTYGTYRQELADTGSGLYKFAPTVVLDRKSVV